MALDGTVGTEVGGGGVDVAVAGGGVGVGGFGVAVGGTEVGVGGFGVAVAGTGVAVGDVAPALLTLKSSNFYLTTDRSMLSWGMPMRMTVILTKHSKIT